MGRIRHFFRQDKDYFHLNSESILKQNYLALKESCFFYSIVLFIYTIYTILFDSSSLLIWLYCIYGLIHLVISYIVFHDRRALNGDYTVSKICMTLFITAFLSFFLVEAVFPFPDKQNIYFPFPIIMVVLIFILNSQEMMLMILGYIVPFFVLVLVFKAPEVQRNDISVAIGTLIASIFGYSLVAKIRFKSMAVLEQLKKFSTIDQLTGLYNKESFENLVTVYLRENKGKRNYALLFLDINKFKLVNERFGHQVGDSLLKTVADEIRLSFYEKDILGRFGGDEFLIFIKDVESEEVVNSRVVGLQNRFSRLSKTLKTGDLDFSFGYAMRESPNENYTNLLARADASLFLARKSANGSVDFAEKHFREKAFQNTSALLEQHKSEPADEHKRKRLVLVADDNKLNRQLLKNILASEYEVLEAVNGKEALDKMALTYKELSAVLLDLMMPEMDGYNVLEQMQNSHLFSSIPVIVTTGSMKFASEEKALTLGANDYVLKPYQPSIILHRLRNTINLRESAALINSAERDALTGAYSREAFYEKASELIISNKVNTYDILYTDIERFKVVNELFGERTGDELLRYLAAYVTKAARAEIKLLGRLGADNFALLILHHQIYSNSDFEAFAKYVNEFPISLELRVRIGIYPVDNLSIPVRTMCDRAMIASDSIKGKYGVHFAYYDKAFTQRTLNEQFILDNMELGLQERQFQVYYQPKINLATGTVAGHEALVRWIHPQKGFMAPAEFIPLFEKNGFIQDMDLYVWDQVCRDLNDWIRRGMNIVPVSVNVSRADLYNPLLPEVFAELLKQYRLKPEYLHLEITETAYTDNSEQLVNMVGILQKLGLIIEMDDFGSGYSSLNMLAKLPIDILKLDMAFIRENTSKNNSDIMKSIAYLSRLMKLPIVAEGVETVEQVENLKKVGCQFAQGYYYAKPMPKADLERYLSINRIGGE